jgi:hypothetical protein
MWVELGTINLLDSNEALFSLGTDVLPVVDDLEVRVVYLAPQDAVPVMFDSAQLQFVYEPGVVEPVVLGPSDQEPNFLVSSIKTDIEEGNVRAVLLERGGILELWAALTERSTDIQWVKLTTGSSVSGHMPIGVKAGTVFWFDENGQSLFAYDLNKASLIGTAAPLSEDGRFELVFDDSRQPLLVTYHPETNTLDFTPAPSHYTP